MAPTAVAAGADQPQARPHGRGLPRHRAGAPDQDGRARAEGRVEALDEGRVDRGGAPLGRHQPRLHRLGRPLRDPPATPTTRRLAYRLPAWASSTPAGNTKRGQPALPVGAASRRTSCAWEPWPARPSTHSRTAWVGPPARPRASSVRIRGRSRRTLTTPPSHSRLVTVSAIATRSTPPTIRTRNSSPAPAPTPPGPRRRRAREPGGTARPPRPGRAPPSARPSRRRRRAPAAGTHAPAASPPAHHPGRLVRAVQRRPRRRAEGLAATGTPVPPLPLAMDHEVPLAPAPVGPAGRVVAELAARVHAPPPADVGHQQGGAGPAHPSTRRLIHGSLGCYRTR